MSGFILFLSVCPHPPPADLHVKLFARFGEKINTFFTVSRGVATRSIFYFAMVADSVSLFVGKSTPLVPLKLREKKVPCPAAVSDKSRYCGMHKKKKKKHKQRIKTWFCEFKCFYDSDISCVHAGIRQMLSLLVWIFLI